MGELKIKLSDPIEKAFRKMAMKRFGYQKGSMSEAASEAIGEWTEMYESTEKIEDPIEAISGIMKHIKKTSVELQHEAGDYIYEKYLNKNRKKR